MNEKPTSVGHVEFEHLPPAERVMAAILYFIRPFADRPEPDSHLLHLSYETVMKTFDPASPKDILPEERERLERFLKLLEVLSSRWQSLQEEINGINAGPALSQQDRPTVFQLATESDPVRAPLESRAIPARDSDLHRQAAQLQAEWDRVQKVIRSKYEELTAKYGEGLWTSVAKHISNTVSKDIPLDD